MRPRRGRFPGARLPAGARSASAVAAAILALAGCARIGLMHSLTPPVAPVKADSTRQSLEEKGVAPEVMHALFSDTLIGFVPGSADTSRRFLGRLRDGYTADTLNVLLMGDNRPGFRISRLNTEGATLLQMFSLNPVKILHGLITIPWAFAKGMFPDLALIRDIPGELRHWPTWGREHQVLNAMLAKVDTLHAHGQTVAAVINTGDLVNDGRRPAHWERFLRIARPLSSRVPYFAVAGNHEQTWTPEGVENWRTATGLPVGSDRLYYCFDSADGWVRFIALDSNPMTDPGVNWSREAEVKYSKEEIDWMVRRLKEHRGPSFVFMHNPPFSAGYHRMEWQSDSVLIDRRARMVEAMHAGGISILAAGHEHDYERALFTWPDAVLIDIVTAGGGAPLHPLPPPAESAQLFSKYRVAGAVVDSANVHTGEFNNFVHVRLWFGGGEFFAYAVDKDGKATLADQVKIDLKRYGIPKIDQHKVPIAPTAPVHPSSEQTKMQKGIVAKGDTVAASKRIETLPPPGKKRVR